MPVAGPPVLLDVTVTAQLYCLMCILEAEEEGAYPTGTRKEGEEARWQVCVGIGIL